ATRLNIVLMLTRFARRCQPLGTALAVQPGPVEISLRGIGRTRGEVQPSALLIHPVKSHDIIVAPGHQRLALAVPADAIDMPPAVLLGHPEEFLAACYPVPTRDDPILPYILAVDKGAVPLVMELRRPPRADFAKEQLALILFPVQLLDD